MGGLQNYDHKNSISLATVQWKFYITKISTYTVIHSITYSVELYIGMNPVYST